MGNCGLKANLQKSGQVRKGKGSEAEGGSCGSKNNIPFGNIRWNGIGKCTGKHPKQKNVKEGPNSIRGKGEECTYQGQGKEQY